MLKSKITLYITTALVTIGCFAALFGVVSSSKSAQALADTPWGPDRATFTWDNPAPYAVFNSIIDNPQVGDERNFVRIREINSSTYSDSVHLEMGKTYEVYIYYHNNADAHDVGTTAIGIADGAAMKSSFPATVKKGNTETVTATVFASDTDPLAVWDGAYVTATDRDIYLRYIPGTAIIHNGGDLNGQSIGPDYLFSDTGALLGYNRFSGILPGCNQYAGYVTYQLFADSPDFTVEKTVVSNTKEIHAGDEITYKIRYTNTGTMDQLNVVVRDTLSNQNLIYIPGSTMLYNNNLPNGKSVNDDIVTQNGMNIGDYAGGSGWAEIVYKVKIGDEVRCGGKLKNIARVSTADGDKTSSVVINITPASDCDPQPEEPEEPEEPEDPEIPVAPETPETPETPEEIVNTGPLEIVLAIIILLGIGLGGFYFYRTRKTLKTIEGQVSGKDSDEEGSQDLPKS